LRLSLCCKSALKLEDPNLQADITYFTMRAVRASLGSSKFSPSSALGRQ
jgi:hypothetical protein